MRVVGRPTPAAALRPSSPAAKRLDDKTLSNAGRRRSTRHAGTCDLRLCAWLLPGLSGNGSSRHLTLRQADYGLLIVRTDSAMSPPGVPNGEAHRR